MFASLFGTFLPYIKYIPWTVEMIWMDFFAFYKYRFVHGLCQSVQTQSHCRPLFESIWVMMVSLI